LSLCQHLLTFPTDITYFWPLARLDAMVKRAAGDFSSFRVQKTNFGGVIEDFWLLLNEQELIEELQGNH
jgi:hypothetical protein